MQREGCDWLIGTRAIAAPYLCCRAGAKGHGFARLDRLATFSSHKGEDAGVKAAMQAEEL